MLHMILSYRNNKKLRSKESIFETQKSFGESTTTSNAEHKSIEIKKLSPEQLEYFRNKSILSRRKNLIQIILVSFGLILILGSLSVVIYGKIMDYRSDRFYQKELLQYSNDLEDYNIYLNRAAQFENENSWPEAIYELKHALIIFPDKPEANFKLADTYVKACTNGSIYCNDGIKFISSLIKKYPNNTKLHELRAILYNSIGEVDRAMEDYEMVNK